MERKSYIKISPQLYIFAAVIALTVPILWVAGWMIAVAVHELSHYLLLRLCGKEIDCVHFDISGAKIQTEGLTDWQTVLCALAGPIGGFLLLLIKGIFPEAALCSLLLSVYNLIPIFPLDGGRAFRGIVHILLPDHIGEKVFAVFEILVMLGLGYLCVVASLVWKLGFIPLLFAVLFLGRVHGIKIPCKSILNAVQ